MTALLTVDLETMKSASFVAAHANLRDLFLLRMNVQQDPGDRCNKKVRPGAPQIDILTPKHRIVGPGCLLVEAGVKIEFAAAGAKRPERSKGSGRPKRPTPLVTIEVVYGAEYDLPKAPMPDFVQKRGLQDFAMLNGIYNSWPYLRQEVDRLTSSMGIRFVMPLLRINTKTAPTTTGPAAGSAGSARPDHSLTTKTD